MPVPIGARPPKSLLLPILGGIVALSWFALWWLEQSPYGWLFHRHGSVDHSQHVETSSWIYAATFLIGWLLMTAAMMLPTTIPLVRLFQRMILQRQYTRFLIALLLAGYLLAWILFGVIAFALIWTIDRTVADVMLSRPWIWAAALFVLAGSFQLSPLKYACLDRCRSPFGFIVSHWHGRNSAAEAFHIGWAHGVFCVGCCWALMLLMFAVGTASLGWMLLLAVVMAIEKNSPSGKRISRPLGCILLGAGAGIGFYNLAI